MKNIFISGSNWGLGYYTSNYLIKKGFNVFKGNWNIQ